MTKALEMVRLALFSSGLLLAGGAGNTGATCRYGSIAEVRGTVPKLGCPEPSLRGAKVYFYIALDSGGIVPYEACLYKAAKEDLRVGTQMRHCSKWRKDGLRTR